MIKTTAVLVLSLSVLPVVVRAELAAASAPPAVPAAPAPKLAPPAPATEVEQMRKWEGPWKTVATFAKSAMMPEGGEAKGTYTVVRGLNGHAFIGDYKATGTRGEFVGHRVRVWDPASHKWKNWWFDSWAPGNADVTAGEVAADGSFVSESESEYQGQKYRLRITERWVDDNKVEQVYENDVGSGWSPMVTVVYTRKGKWKERPAPAAQSEKPKKSKKSKDAKEPDAKRDKPDKSGKGDKAEKSDKADKAAPADKAEKSDGADTDKPKKRRKSKAQKPDTTADEPVERPQSIEPSARPEKSDGEEDQ